MESEEAGQEAIAGARKRGRVASEDYLPVNGHQDFKSDTSPSLQIVHGRPTTVKTAVT